MLRYFRTLSGPVFASTGDVANETVVLEPGPLEQFPFSIEPRLRALGLHTALRKGVIELEQEHTVCEAGKPLTSDAARILVRILNLNYCLNRERFFPTEFLHFHIIFSIFTFSSQTTGTQQELLGMRMAEFKITAEYCWSESTGLMDVTKEEVVEEKKKKTVKRRSKVEVPATPTRRSSRVSERMKSKVPQNTVRHEEEEEEALMELN